MSPFRLVQGTSNPARQIQYWLKPYYGVMNILNFPTLGSLIVT